ncbi:arsenate reductase family protein [Xylocopilactobacillus apicola]|uniref:ArsC family transcriptional regulator n=1 Tax=Xylocopilactobacillus apicola TaxID=2932184 RepID=A0AAU9DB89_9LACO|nr:arsenate reductase family protein [Xylocopilactobacillus apicola]BDR58037.1 ArsC family transcriptional regulator [Xylocopilactobacillus apicola]
MKITVLQYPPCSTCKKALKWLNDHNIEYQDRNIKTNNPTKAELEAWYHKSDYPLKRFFNTSGQKYRELNLKDKIGTASEDELLTILATDGMLVKRPLVIGSDFVLVGFKEAEWEEKLL